MICKNCGTNNIEGAAFCKLCGTPLNTFQPVGGFSGRPNPSAPQRSYPSSPYPNPAPAQPYYQPPTSGTAPVQPTYYQPVPPNAVPVQPVYYQPVVPRPAPVAGPSGGAILALGIISFVTSGVVLGFILAIIALSMCGKRQRLGCPNSGSASAGKVFAILGLIGSIIAIVYWLVYAAFGAGIIALILHGG